MPMQQQTTGQLDPTAALALAIDTVGGVSAMARAIGVTPSAVSQWTRAPSERAIDIERATALNGGKPAVTRHQLRPDLYPEGE